MLAKDGIKGKSLSRRKRVIAEVKSGRAFAEEVRKNRRLGIISGEINVIYLKKLNEVHINADRGRARKPYIVVEAGASASTPRSWSQGCRARR